jgi:hypothetical protein
MEEIWKTVEATKGHYEVSNLGNVRKDGEIVEPHEDANGYMKVKIVLIYGTMRIWLHRLVAATFIENPENKLQVNHIDGNKHNNAVSNLEWVTNSENQRHRIDILGKNNKGESNPMYGIKEESSPVFKGYIYQIDPKTKEILGKFAGSGDVERTFPGYKRSGLLKAVNGTNKTYKGFIWTRDISGFKIQ